ncbi:hypothetical protein [Microvirga antarctica]|uniref:hypothetical protein n=1 Tax=Microvirga antarctica TaxID=2819233 RepID=UPI001B31887D|nr:hypothetical protein [Microvirga antarctica]
MSSDRVFANDMVEPIDRQIISLRAYVTRPPKEAKRSRQSTDRLPRTPASEWVLVFDCETRTTPDQRLRFGAYQLRYRGQIWERGVFYEPAVLSLDEETLLRNFIGNDPPGPDGERVCFRTRSEFVEEVFYQSAFDVGAQIVGFNLPFDLSRLAIRHSSARGSMRGGFSLELAGSREHIVVKHLSQRAALIRFAGKRLTRGGKGDFNPDENHEVDREAGPDRGYFVDVKTLAAALTSGSHSLDSLCRLLEVPTAKEASDDHGGPLTDEYVRYALRDVQTTWECFAKLAKRFSTFGLVGTGLYDLYSEASLGKAYLKTMGIKPWRDVQPDFPPHLIGHILSAYYGGRSEVHIRREIVPVIHCDFLSMYPTVCTLMSLWTFVRADGIKSADRTKEIRQLVATPRAQLVERLRHKEGWQGLTALVQVRPKRNLSPVRAEYADAETATIGLNFLTSDEPMWFTLADVLASRILTGETPEIVSAIQFEPSQQQTDLMTIKVAGREIDPASDDFYQRLIIHRNALKAQLKSASDTERPALKADEQAIKVLANATSYGIFVELNGEEYNAAKPMLAYGAGPKPLKFSSKKFEKPGRYFHPLLGTLITGAARLMLALAEHQVAEQKLDWAFCDTDSIAIANRCGLPPDEFKSRALLVRDWFKDLNPYDEDRSILQLEDVNFPVGKAGDLASLEPPLCLAVSAKRYVLFNRNGTANIIRKASGHGLGHLLAPYDELAVQRRARIERIGVPLWQEDLWQEIIRAAQSDTPDQTRFMEMTGFDAPAGSQYAATTPELLSWFKGYNERQPEGHRVFPFGFLLSLQAKSRLEMAKDQPEGLSDQLWRMREPRPAAPFFKRSTDAKDHAFDRDLDIPIPASWLKSHGRSLIRYHMHPETKFRGGEADQRGPLTRRHVFALSHRSIGKESDSIEENEFIGEDLAQLKQPLLSTDRQKLLEFISSTQEKRRISDRALIDKANVSHHTLRKLRQGESIDNRSLEGLIRAANYFASEADFSKAANEIALEGLRRLHTRFGGRNALAKHLRVSGPYLGRVLSGEKPMTKALAEKVKSAVRDI